MCGIDWLSQQILTQTEVQSLGSKANMPGAFRDDVPCCDVTNASKLLVHTSAASSNSGTNGVLP